MSNDPELELLGLIEAELPSLSNEARTRVVGWAIAWLIEKAGATSATRRVAAFNLASRAVTALVGEDRRALIDALAALEPRPVAVRVTRPLDARWSRTRQRTRQPRHCKKCGATDHDARKHNKPGRKIEPTDLLEME